MAQVEACLRAPCCGWHCPRTGRQLGSGLEIGVPWLRSRTSEIVWKFADAEYTNPSMTVVDQLAFCYLPKVRRRWRPRQASTDFRPGPSENLHDWNPSSPPIGKMRSAAAMSALRKLWCRSDSTVAEGIL